MIPGSWRTALAAAALVAVAADARSQPVRPVTILDVPYLPQSEALCGGAAAAMVMRYWGATGIYAESFSELVDREAGGIRGEALLRALRDRGWDARSFRGDAALVQEQLAARRPVVALIEDRPGRFHYVVVVAWAGGRVLVHDPARAPYRVLDESSFHRAWSASDFWTLVALPEKTGTLTVLAEPAPNTESVAVLSGRGLTTTCAGMVEEGVRLAGGGDSAAARRLFELAADACPQAAAPWREMAGLHALSGEWRKTADAARRATTLDPDDHHAWRTLATALFLENDPLGALAAWNRVGEPRIDLVNIRGLERIRHEVAADALALAPQAVLTPDALARGRRRIAELPAAQVARVSYRPGENGDAQVDVVVIERPLLPTSLPALAATGVRAIASREVSVTIASPSGGAERWDVSYRWWERRPRVGLAFSSPTPFGGIWRLEAFDERQTYDGDAAIVERRRGALFAVHDWIDKDTRIDASAGIDRWRGSGTSMSLGGALERRLLQDRMTIAAHGRRWLGGAGSWSGGVSAEWRSSVSHEGHVVIARGGAGAAGGDARFGLWHGAGTGQPEGALLRAHPMLDSGVVDRAVLGRRLLHAGGEWRRWIQPRRRPFRYAPAVFVDVARAFDGAAFSDTRTHVDAGLGVRVPVPGSGVVRLDIARGLRDGKTALSIGWIK